MSQAGIALAVEVEHPGSGGIERFEAGDVVAYVVDQLRIARGVRAVGLVDQLSPIGRAIKGDLLPPWRSHNLVVAEHGLPGRTRMRRLDHWIGLIAKLSFAIGELELR